MIKDAKDLGVSLGIPCLDGIEEAEAQCALLNSCGFADGCFTADSDVFLFGARTVYRDIYLGDGGYVICYEMNEIESKLGFGRNSLVSYIDIEKLPRTFTTTSVDMGAIQITLALLLGGDYSQKVHGIGQETACQLVKSIGEENILQQTMSQGLAFAKKKDVGKSSDRSLIANVNMENKQCSEMKNIDEKQNPKLDEHSQSVINAYLRPNCHSPESVELPVGYHVASILKHRKLNGVECLEVSWGGEPKVRPSIVPASVLRSACPEMLSEFTSKGAKKQNPCKARRKQSENEKLVLDEVETQLKDLVLHGEYQSIDMNGANSCIIDLSTPSPPIHMHKHGACKSNVLQVDVIDLSESDEERPSIDHESRARELRTFLASIKEDLSS
ncbi:Flap endonuclease GEN-like 2 [Nymphaea thermarum]|nr:Flap endonuclease GEN-like 2 [Nymphaea thermarum]